MPRVYIEWLEGRTNEQRRKLVNDIIDSFVKNINLKPEQVTIDFIEISPKLHYKGGETTNLKNN